MREYKRAGPCVCCPGGQQSCIEFKIDQDVTLKHGIGPIAFVQARYSVKGKMTICTSGYEESKLSYDLIQWVLPFADEFNGYVKAGSATSGSTIKFSKGGWDVFSAGNPFDWKPCK